MRTSSGNGAAQPNAERRTRILGALAVLFVFLMGLAHLYLAQQRNLDSEIQKVVNFGDTVGAMLNAEKIRALPTLKNFPQGASYQEMYHSLSSLVSVNSAIAHAYLVCMVDDEPIFLMDSGPSPLTRKNSPGDIFQDERLLFPAVWSSQETRFTGAVHNNQGDWVSTLTPILDEKSGKAVAILGITYPKGPWDEHLRWHITTDVLVILSVLILAAGVYRILIEHARLKDRSAVLARDEALFHAVFDQAPIGISIGNDNKVTYTALSERYSVNRMFETILGRDRETLEKTDWQTITHPDDLLADLTQLNRYKSGEISHYTLEKRFIRPDGSLVWTNMTIGTLTDVTHQNNMHLCILEDISARKQAEEALLESERSKAVLLSHLPGLAYRCKFDRDWTMEFVSEGCEPLTGYEPEALVDNRDLSYNDLVAPEYRELLWAEWEQVLQQHRHFRYEYQIITKSGSRKWVLELGQFIFAENGTVAALEGIVIDITEQKMREAQISYLNNHDYLTGLYNRSYFEREKKRFSGDKYLPLSVMVCDINGVRLINDAFGLAEGDRLICDIAHILQSHTRVTDVLSRTGGDEFTLLLPNTTEAEADEIFGRITHTIDQYKQDEKGRTIEASVSFGLSTMTCGGAIDQTMANAEERLNHRKLLTQKSSHNAILSSIMATLYARSQETEEHGKRLTHLTRQIGERMGLDAGTLDELELLSMLHDIGKIGVDDRILNKPARLNAEEWELMKRHSEIGYRIALSSPELEHIALYILCHHEQWNGSGYPQGLQGEEIPLPARILTVADAYDAMTQDRVYHLAIPQAEALAEIERCAGSQFDPAVAKLFIDVIVSTEPDASLPDAGLPDASRPDEQAQADGLSQAEESPAKEKEESGKAENIEASGTQITKLSDQEPAG